MMVGKKGKQKALKKSRHGDRVQPESGVSEPKLARRYQNRETAFKMGRTIGEKRERLQTANERAAARAKGKKRQARRVTWTILGFVGLVAVLVFICFFFVGNKEPVKIIEPQEVVVAEPTVEIIDEDAAAGGNITNRMRSYVGQAEQDFRDLEYRPVKVVVPSGTVREVDFYLEGVPGYVKLHIDRGTAVSVEDADRMIRYLAGQGINEYQYIDVRIGGKAYWK